MDNELHYDVKPVKVTNSAAHNHVDRSWPVDDRIYGFYPGIFGPGWYGDDGYSLQCPALDHLDTRRKDPFEKLFDTPEAAMEAWHNAKPVQMTTGTGANYFLKSKNVDTINALGFYRHYEEDPDPGLWDLADIEEIEF